MSPFFRTNKAFSYVGLAVHHERLSLMKLKQIKKQMVIEGFTLLPLPQGTLVDGNVQQPALLNQLKRWIEKYEADQCAAALALPNSQVINKKIKIPAFLNEEEQRAEINANLKLYLPGMTERLYFDFIPLEKYAQERELQLIAARAEQVEIYVDLMLTAGLKINVVDVDTYAIVRAVQWIAEHLTAETIVILDRDVSTAQLILLKQGNVISVYPIMCDSDEDIFFQQIKIGMHFFSAIPASSIFKRMVLTGNLSYSEKFRKRLESELKLSIETINAFKRVVLDSSISLEELNGNISGLMTAFGVALRGIS